MQLTHVQAILLPHDLTICPQRTWLILSRLLNKMLGHSFLRHRRNLPRLADQRHRRNLLRLAPQCHRRNLPNMAHSPPRPRPSMLHSPHRHRPRLANSHPRNLPRLAPHHRRYDPRCLAQNRRRRVTKHCAPLLPRPRHLSKNPPMIWLQSLSQNFHQRYQQRFHQNFHHR